jgi:hypothetical protein
MKTAAALVLAALLAPLPSAAEPLALRPRLAVGSSYPLRLSVATNTEASSGGAGGSAHAEDVRLEYHAAVTVLEVDGDGRPLRERHEGVRLTFERPGESGSLFKEGAAFEVHRQDGIEIRLGRERLEPRAEKIVAGLLEKQFEHTLEPALLQPAREVEVGDTWEPDASLVRRFLMSRGVRVLEMGEDPSATLRRATADEGGDGLVIEYRVPIERLELREMPRNVEVARSDAVLEGWVRLSPEPGAAPHAARSRLSLSLSGVSSVSPQAHPWALQRSETVERTAAGAGDVALSSPAAR